MKTSYHIPICLFLLILVFTSCTKNPAPVAKATVTTISVTAIQQTSASSGGEIAGVSSATIIERGICWSININPTIASSKIAAGNGTGIFSSNMVSLIPGTTYYVRAYATTATETIYGNQQQFTTNGYQLSSITAQPVSVTKQTVAVSGAIISSAGGGTISAKGICWSTQPTPTIADNKIADSTAATTFSSKLTGLNASTTYYIRAYAVNEAGTAYSSAISFTTLAVSAPIMDDVAVSSITNTKVTCVGNVSDDGGAPITDRGICMALAPNPTITTAAVFTNGAGTGSIVAFISGLSSGTTYYVRSYATNSKGTSYSTQVVFKTL